MVPPPMTDSSSESSESDSFEAIQWYNMSFEDRVNGHDVSHMYHINEVLCNLYSREDDERINWHDDMDELYQTSTDVLSLSVGSPDA